MANPQIPLNDMTEAQIQAQLIKWWELAHKGLGVADRRLLIMVPNGAYLGSGTKQTKRGPVSLAAIRFAGLKRQGFVQGAPDLFLSVCRIHNRQFCGGMYLEMKKPGGRCSPEQREMHALLRNVGYQVNVAYGFDEAVNHIVDYLAGAPIAALPL